MQKKHSIAPDLTVQIAPRNSIGLLLKNPVMTASGTYGYGVEYKDSVDIEALGAIICKGTTLEPWNGNAQPRLIETTHGLLNAVGLENIGIKSLISDVLPQWRTLHVPFIINIAGHSIDEYVQLAEIIDGLDGVHAVELNISCPNVACGGMEFGVDPDMAAKVTTAVRSKLKMPMLVKLSPNVTDIVAIATAVAEAGADALTLINTVSGMAIDIKKRRPSLGNIFGGLSGAAIKPIALASVYRVAQRIDVPVIGCGGIFCAEDAIEFFMAGASAVQVGTASFCDPNAPIKIVNGIAQYLQNNAIQNIRDLIGAARI
ncbi:MAG TPA: dihydroorotate dehydrogenase [Dehalococcoidia bacterium]|nr:dihydroorotate dehydrogenase [Dehalococcoidia bacterium]